MIEECGAEKTKTSIRRTFIENYRCVEDHPKTVSLYKLWYILQL